MNRSGLNMWTSEPQYNAGIAKEIKSDIACRLQKVRAKRTVIMQSPDIHGDDTIFGYIYKVTGGLHVVKVEGQVRVTTVERCLWG